MTHGERRIITFLSTILFVLLIAILVLLGTRYKASRAQKAEAQKQENSPITITEDGQVLGYRSLSYSTGSVTLNFALREDGSWYWADDSDFPLDDSHIQEMLKLLDNLAPQQILKDGSAGDHGLEQPDYVLTATLTDDSTRSVAYGSATTEPGSHYALRDDDMDVVYIYDDALYDAMQVPIYAMYDLAPLPQPKETSVQSIIIRGHTYDDENPENITDQLTVITSQKKSDTAVAWMANGSDISSNELLKALLDDVLHLQLTRCIDYHPSAEAAKICGLEKPDADFTLEYLDNSGLEQTLTICIGNRLADGSGRYVRVGEDSSIFLLETALLDPLMPIASAGLQK